jgi:outer membrane protein assembly factor BamA
MTAALLLATLLAQAPSPWDYAVLPIAFYAPETSMALGAGAFIFEAGRAAKPGPRRDDTLALVVIGTTRQQFVVGVEGTKYLRGGAVLLGGELVATHFPNRYWGLGNQSSDTFDLYTPSRVGVGLTGAIRVLEEVYLGLAGRGGLFRSEGYAPDNMVATYFAEHGSRGRLIGLGPVLRRDTRDDVLHPRSGSLTAFAALLSRRGLGSSHDYARLDLDQRAYLSLGAGGKGVLALQAYGEWTLGDVPLDELPALGGSSRLRGFYEGRYRDRLYLMTQAEWRVPVVWRLALAPFVAAGDVFPKLSAVSAERVKLAGGLGLRFNLNRKRPLNLRIDVAGSRRSHGVYLNLGEAF